MSSMKSILVLTTVVFILSMVVGALCSIEIKDKAKSHIVVETCTDIGTFSLGNYYENWEELTYNYPQPWEGTFIIINVNNTLYSNSPYAKDSIHMDPYVLESPHKVGNSIVTKWKLPEGIIVNQELEMISNGSRIKLNVENPTSQSIKVGARILLDTKLNGNDGAVIFIPEIGFIEREASYTSKINSLRLQDSIDNPSAVAMIDFSDEKIKPDKIIISNWKKTYLSGWDYKVDVSKSIKLDSAVILYYNPRVIDSMGNITYCFYYGKTEETCSDGIKNQKETDVDCGGPCKPCSLGKFCSANSDCESGYCYNGRCESAPIIGISWEILILVIVLILIVMLVIFLVQQKKKVTIPSKVPEKPVHVEILPGVGKVIASKFKKGKNVTLSVSNKSNQNIKDCRVEDKIPEGIEILDISSKNTNIEGDMLTWFVGELISGKRKSMSYSISRDIKEIPPINRLSFISKELVKAEILRKKK